MYVNQGAFYFMEKKNYMYMIFVFIMQSWTGIQSKKPNNKTGLAYLQ
jgi:hypothetical protein